MCQDVNPAILYFSVILGFIPDYSTYPDVLELFGLLSVPMLAILRVQKLLLCDFDVCEYHCWGLHRCSPLNYIGEVPLIADGRGCL